MTELEMISRAKSGDSKYQLALFEQYKGMIQKHMVYFSGHTDEYRQEAFLTLLLALDYFDMDKVKDSNYRFMRVYNMWLKKQDKDFSKSLGMEPEDKKKDVLKESISKKHEPACKRRQNNLRYYRNKEMSFDEQIYVDERTERNNGIIPMQMALLERLEKEFLPHLTDKNKMVYDAMKRGITKPKDISKITGINWRSMEHHHIERIRREIEKAQKRIKERKDIESLLSIGR